MFTVGESRGKVLLSSTISFFSLSFVLGRLVVLCLTALSDSISVYIGPYPRERGRKKSEIINEKNVQTIPIRTYCKRNRPLPYYYSISRTPRHRKFIYQSIQTEVLLQRECKPKTTHQPQPTSFNGSRSL